MIKMDEEISSYNVTPNACKILKGTFAETYLKQLRPSRLENTLKKIIAFAKINRVLNEGADVENHTPPEWWPLDKTFKNLETIKEGTNRKDWIPLLRDLTVNSISFYRKSPVDLQMFRKKKHVYCKTLKTRKVAKKGYELDVLESLRGEFFRAKQTPLGELRNNNEIAARVFLNDIELDACPELVSLNLTKEEMHTRSRVKDAQKMMVDRQKPNGNSSRTLEKNRKKAKKWTAKKRCKSFIRVENLFKRPLSFKTKRRSIESDKSDKGRRNSGERQKQLEVVKSSDNTVAELGKIDSACLNNGEKKAIDVNERQTILSGNNAYKINEASVILTDCLRDAQNALSPSRRKQDAENKAATGSDDSNKRRRSSNVSDYSAKATRRSPRLSTEVENKKVVEISQPFVVLKKLDAGKTNEMLNGLGLLRKTDVEVPILEEVKQEDCLLNDESCADISIKVKGEQRGEVVETQRVLTTQPIKDKVLVVALKKEDQIVLPVGKLRNGKNEAASTVGTKQQSGLLKKRKLNLLNRSVDAEKNRRRSSRIYSGNTRLMDEVNETSFKRELEGNEKDCFINLPTIKLHDIFAPTPVKPVQKNDYMDFLKLKPSPAKELVPASKNKLSENIKYSHLVPFSSELGKLLLRKECYQINGEISERKTDKLNYYLKEQPKRLPECDYAVTCDSKNHPCGHLYNFPSRKFAGRQDYVRWLEETFCRPLSVRLAKVNIDEFYYNKYKCKRLCVMLSKTVE